MAAAALVAAGTALEAVRRACDFLESQIASCTSAASFSWCWLGLAAHGQDPTAACRWQWQKVATGSSTTPRGPYHWALLLWAAAGRENCAWHVIRQRLSKTPRPVSSSLPNLPAAHAHTEPPASPSIH
jgi:hypothetical protein